MMRNLKLLLVLLSVAGGGVSAAARQWSYDDCVEYAREHNISLQKSRLNESVTRYGLEEAKAQWQPTIDFAMTHSYTNRPWGDGGKNAYNSNYGLNAGWTVWNGGVRENNIKRSKLQADIDRLSTTDLFRSVETDLLTVYMNILYAQEAICIYEEAVNLSKAQVERSQALLDMGRASKVDHSQLQSQYEQDCYALVSAQGTYATRCMELKRLLELGIEDTLLVQKIAWDSTEVMTELPPIAESFAMALATDARMQSLDLEVQGSDMDIAIAKAGRAPQISLNAGVGTGYYSPGTGFGEQIKRGVNESVGLTVAVPILDNKKTKTAVAKAKIQKLNAQLDVQQRETELAQNVESWYVDVKSSQARYAAGLEQVKSAELSNTLVNEQFKLGLVNPVELMSAHNKLLEARHSLLQAKYMAILGQKMIEFYRTAFVTMP